MAIIRWRNGYAHLVWYESGKQKSESLGKLPKREAESIRKAFEQEVRSGSKALRSPQFQHYSREYLRWYEREYPDSYYRIRQITVQHLSPFFEFDTLPDITSRRLRDYRDLRLDSGIKNATYNKELRTLKAMLNKAVEWEYIEKNPIGHIKGVKELDSKPPHFYTPADLIAIYSENADFAARWQFLANTGLRRTETVDPDSLMERAVDYPAEVPAGARVLTAGVDIQSDRIEFEVVGWDSGEQSWNIDYQILFGDITQQFVWDELSEALKTRYLHESGSDTALP